MALHLITYDLIKVKNYPRLYETIQSLGKWIHPLESVWIVSSPYTSVQIRDGLQAVIDSDDKLFVCTVEDYASWHFQPSDTAWLKARIND